MNRALFVDVKNTSREDTEDDPLYQSVVSYAP
jgi:hypothetical protein